jgi:hypothetical protein
MGRVLQQGRTVWQSRRDQFARSGVTMPKHRTFKDVLKKIMDDGYYGLSNNTQDVDLLNPLRDLFERWRENQTDSKHWECIADEAERCGLSREASYYQIAATAFDALVAGHPANVVNFSQEALRSQSERYLRLARNAQSLAQHYGKRVEVFGEDGRSGSFAQLHDEQAKDFRQASNDALAKIPWTNRQHHGKKFTREQLSFMRSLVTGMQCRFGKPYYEACAAIANLAYRRVVTAEEVRSACRGMPPIDRRPISDEEAARLRRPKPPKKATGKLKEK